MLTSFFQYGPLPANQILGIYDTHLVLLSYLVATLASYIALDIAGRLRDENITDNEIIYWLLGGAFAMGAGIWSMHFIGMLAFKMSMPLSYDAAWTTLSMIVAICASFFALFLLKGQIIKWDRLMGGGVILGLAIAAMHYTGMHAMNDMIIRYRPNIFLASIVVAIVASEAALWLALKSNKGVLKSRIRMKVVSAVIMGAAICGMHYTGMMAAVFTPSPTSPLNVTPLNPQILSVTIAVVAIFILGIAFALSTYKEIRNQQMLVVSRLAGMTEVATNVLHSVGNVLNSVNVSADYLLEKTVNTRLGQLEKIVELLGKHKSDLPGFMATSQGKLLPEFLQELEKLWRSEHEIAVSELNSILKNIKHIRDIVSTQQSLNYSTNFEQRVTLGNIIEESILITGIDLYKHDIVISRNIRDESFVVDKIKLMQIIVNLIKNAKESVLEGGEQNKTISIQAGKNGKNIHFEVSDNGVGISKSNLLKIFVHGFTTKNKGHGFGLHTSAIFAKQLGGSIVAISDGEGKGAKFVLEIPCRLSTTVSRIKQEACGRISE